MASLASSALAHTAGPARRFTLRRSERLVSKRSFEHIMKRGRRYHGEIFAAHTLTGRTPRSRLGLIVSRKVGNSPQRNRMKRLLRETFRRHKHHLPRPMDIILRARERSGERTLRLADVEREWLRMVTLIEKDFAV